MRSYVPPYPLCDEILFYFAQSSDFRRWIEDINNRFPGNTHINSVIGQLVKDGYLHQQSPGMYLLLASGSAFISDGGYKAEFQRQNEAEELIKRVHESSISVAASVKRTNWLTVIVAAISAFGTVGTLILTCNLPRSSKTHVLADTTQKVIANPPNTKADSTPVLTDSSKRKSR